MTRDELDGALLKAHADKDTPALIKLYTVAATLAEDSADTDAACFYLTHAFVFALEAGTPEADALHQRLANYGRASRWNSRAP